MDRVLVVGNQTLSSDEVIAAVLVRNAAGPCAFHLIVPATPLSDQERALHHSEHPGAVAFESGPVALARMRLAQAIARLAEAGITATGDVGDPHAITAIEAAARKMSATEVIVATLPQRMSRWLAQDLPRRITRRLGLPVTHVETGAFKPGRVGPRRGANHASLTLRMH